MRVSRRSVIGGTAAFAAIPAMGRDTLARQATPIAESVGAPGFGLVRARLHATAAIAQAVYPEVMTHFLPPTREVPGYHGYVFAFNQDDPTGVITATFVSDETAANEAAAVAREYVDGVEPRLTPETPFSQQGALRIYHPTDRAASETPPFLHDCLVTMRHRMNAPDIDIDAVVALAQDGLAPMLAAMDGFVLYAWIQVEGGRVAINIWETAEQLDAGNAAVADFVAENTVETTVGEPVVYTGPIGYSDLLGADSHDQ
jgi:hypothetical protein